MQVEIVFGRTLAVFCWRGYRPCALMPVPVLARGMTNQILQSDIEFAARLLREGTPDSEIVGGLGLRGISPESALNLLVELRSGKRIVPELNIVRPAPARPSPNVQVRRRRTPKPRTSASAAWDQLRDHTKTKKASRIGPFVVLLLAAIVLVIGVLAITNHRYHKHTAVLLSQVEGNLFDFELAGRSNSVGNLSASGNSDSLDEARMLLNETAGRRLSATEKSDLLSFRKKLEALSSALQTEASSPLTLELREDGLHVGQFSLNQDNSLTALAHVLGVPSRTNEVEQTERTINAYDSDGLLVYCRKNGLIDSVVLDFSGLGGTYGCSNSFRGVLKVENNIIAADTDPKALVAIRPLGLTNIADGEVFAGSYGRLSLSFAYLNPPAAKLSIVVIDFK